MKTVCLSFACLCMFAVQAQTQVPAAKKPNIIFILGDDVGYYNLTVNGGESYSTPNLDSMARHGMNFTHCESLPLCCPSRLMLLSGKYSNRNYSNWGYMNDSEKTVGNVMQSAGYVTGFLASGNSSIATKKCAVGDGTLISFLN